MKLTFLLPQSLQAGERVVVVLRRTADIDPRYEVLLDGALIGSVRRGWFRLGGESWTHNGITGQPTRRAAVLSLLRRHLTTKREES